MDTCSRGGRAQAPARHLGPGLDSAPDDRTRPDRRDRHRGGALPVDAARHGRRNCRQPHAAPWGRTNAEPHHPWDLRARPLCGRPGCQFLVQLTTKGERNANSPASWAAYLRRASFGHQGRYRVSPVGRLTYSGTEVPGSSLPPVESANQSQEQHRANRGEGLMFGYQALEFHRRNGAGAMSPA